MEPDMIKAIETAIKALVTQIAPEARFLPKYGGEVFAPDPNDDRSIVGGVFAYKDHVSVEFSQGATFDDPEGHLEGGGKLRRHLKLTTPQDVTGKTAEAFLRQAFAT